ncbi:MAG: fimbrillin family protein [Bacteroidales bacterium]|nr:fimbrillin family protein [Bacteroidales bacterium]
MKQSITLLATALAALLCSCNVETPVKVLGNVVIEPVITRATETDFENGDAIGVTITRAGEAYATNERMVYGEDAFTSNLPWYRSGEQSSDFLAYYPYSETVPTTFSVAQDQSGEGYGNSDLMAAVKKGVTPQASVSMVFKHLLTRIVIDIDNQGGAAIQGVTLKNSIINATVNLESGECVPALGAEACDIAAHKVTDNSRYIAIIVPQTVKFTAEVQLAGGVTISKKLSEVTLKAGGQYTIVMTVLPTDVNMAISGQIEAWSDEGIIPEKQVSFSEDEDGFEYDGVEYKTVVLANGSKWMAENLRFVPEGCVLGEPVDEGATVFYPYSTDGENTTALKDEASIAKFGLLYSGDLLFSTAVNAGNVHDFEGARGICPPGWHVPTRAEYLALCGNSNKDDSGTEKSTVIDKTALFYDPGYDAAKVKNFNDGGWNLVFSGCVANNGVYNKNMIVAEKCKYEEWVGSCAMNFYWTSTGYLGSSATAKPQFFALMTTFTASNNEGKVSLSYCNSSYAAPLRCVKDAQ